MSGYLDHWGLRAPFFYPGLDAHQPETGYCPLPHLEAGLKSLGELALQEFGLGVLTGASGMGKSTLLRVLRARIKDAHTDVFVGLRLPTSVDHGAGNLWMVEDLGRFLRPGSEQMWGRVRAGLEALVAEQRHLYLLVDIRGEVHGGSLDVIERLFHLCQIAAGPRLSALAIAETESWEAFRHHGFVRARLAWHWRLPLWDLLMVQSFVGWCTRKADLKRALFQAKAIEHLTTVAGGIPARLCALGEQALRLAALDQARAVEVEHVERAGTTTVVPGEGLGAIAPAERSRRPRLLGD